MQGDCKLKVATEYLLCTNDRGFLKKVIVQLDKPMDSQFLTL